MTQLNINKHETDCKSWLEITSSFGLWTAEVFTSLLTDCGHTVTVNIVSADYFF